LSIAIFRQTVYPGVMLKTLGDAGETRGMLGLLGAITIARASEF